MFSKLIDSESTYVRNLISSDATMFWLRLSSSVWNQGGSEALLPSMDKSFEKSQAVLGLRERARRYKDLAETFSDSQTIDKLTALAAEFDKNADEIEAEFSAELDNGNVEN
jgi:hypothetical protein